MRKSLFWLGAVVGLALLLVPRDVEGQESINLRVGETREFPTSPGERIIVGNSKVLGYKVRSNAVYVSGQRSGFTTLTVGDQSYSVNVYDAGDLEDLRIALVEMLGDIEGVEVRLVAQRLVVSGKVLSQEDLDRVKRTAEALGVISTVILDPNYHFPSPMIHLTFHFAEVSRELFQDIGIGWGEGVFTTIMQGITVANGFYALAHSTGGNWTVNPIGGTEGSQETPVEQDSLINLLENLDHIRVHEVHEAVVMSGYPDEYMYGGTLLIKVASFQATSVQQIDFGVVIRTIPVVDRAGNIKLSLEYDITDIAESQANGDYRLNKRHQSTTVMVQEGQTLAVGGVLRLSYGEGNRGLPWLSRIPFIGMLFGSQSFQQEKTDGVIFVTPTVIRNEMPGQNTRIRDVVNGLGPLPDLPLGHDRQRR